MDQQLIDRIYECSFLPELWPGVLDELARIAEAGGGTFFTVNSHTGIIRWTASTAIREHMATYVTEGWMMDNQRQRPARLLKALAHHPGFLVEYDVCTAEELEHNPTYRDFLRPRGFGWAAITNISLPTKDRLVFTVERDYDRGPVESAFVQQLDELRPHLARSALMSARLQLERARVTSETLALIGMPALVFDEIGKVLAANHLIEAQTDHIRWRAQDRVSLKDAAADVLFRQAIDTLNITDATRTRSFAVRGADTNAAMVAHTTGCGFFIRTDSKSRLSE